MSLLITQLLEITHGIWIDRNVILHDELTGIYAVEGRDEGRWQIQLQRAIKVQLEQGTNDLCKKDKWPLEVNRE